MQTIHTLHAGAPLEQAQAALLLVHGRGASAQSMLALAEELMGEPDPAQGGMVNALALLAPQAPGMSWYPYPFLAPIAQNEPDLTHSLAILGDALSALAKAGLPPEKVLLLGFSQGACLVLEYTARNARRYGGVVGLSGGLIGPPGTPRSYPGSLQDTPLFLGCSDVDPHIPHGRVLESAQVLEKLGAQVTTRIYPGLGHTVNEDEVIAVRAMLRRLLGW